MWKLAIWVIVLGLVLRAINYPTVEYLGAFLLLAVILGGLLVMMGWKGAPRYFESILVLLLIFLFFTPYLYNLLVDAAAQFTRRLPGTVALPSIDIIRIILIIMAVIFALSLLIFFLRAMITRSNRKRSLSYRESLDRKARIAERTRVIPAHSSRDSGIDMHEPEFQVSGDDMPDSDDSMDDQLEFFTDD